jgi:hypothetical protein
MLHFRNFSNIVKDENYRKEEYRNKTRKYFSEIYIYCNFLCDYDQFSAMYCTQEVFTKFLRKRFCAAIVEPRVWLYQTATTCAEKYMSRKIRR